MSKKWVSWWVLAGLALGLLYGSYLVISPFFGPIFMAVILGVVLHPVERWLRLKTKHPGVSASLATLGTALLFLLPLSFLGVTLGREVSHGVELFNNADLSWLDVGLKWAEKYTGVGSEEMKAMMLERLRQAGGVIGMNVLNTLQGVGGWLMDSVIMLATLFFLFLSGHDLLRDSKEWIPLRSELVDALYLETKQVLFANVYGVVAVAVAQGALTSVGFLIVGLPSALFWGLVAGVLSILPFIGAGLVWGPGALYLLATGSLGKAALLAAWGALIVGMADNVIRPVVLSEGSKMHTGVMFFALLGGIQAFGLIGLFAGPLVFALAISVMTALREESQKLVVE